MIKYKVFVSNDNNKDDFTEIGIIEGWDKIDLAIQLNRLKYEHNVKTKNIKLECIEFDKKEKI